MQTVVFRVDASVAVGEGHLRRCLAVAGHLRDSRILFASAEITPACAELCRAARFPLLGLAGEAARLDEEDDARQLIAQLDRLGAQVDRLVVDHYGLGATWHQLLRPHVEPLIAIDDLADRPLASRVLVDPTYGREGSHYRELLDPEAALYLGVDYCMLRPGFERGPQPPTPEPGLVHLTFGGWDPEGYTAAWARHILAAGPAYRVRAAVGGLPEGAWRGLETLRAEFPDRFDYAQGVSDMAGHMSGCEMAVGSPGTTLWERAALGLPCFCLATHGNQVGILEGLDASGFCVFGGLAREHTVRERVADLAGYLDNEALRREISRQCQQVDGRGAARVAEIIGRGH